MDYINHTKAASQTPRSMNEDERLEAIKDLLVGSSFERINSKFKSLNQRIENGNSHLGKLLKDLNLDFTQLRNELSNQIKEEKKIRFADDDTLRQQVRALQVQLEDQNQNEASPVEFKELEEKHLNLEQKLDQALKELGQSFEGKVNALTVKSKQQEETHLSLADDVKALDQKLTRQLEEQTKNQEEAHQNLTQHVEDLGEKFTRQLEEKNKQQESAHRSLKSELTDSQAQHAVLSNQVAVLEAKVEDGLKNPLPNENFVDQKKHQEDLQELKADLKNELAQTERKIGDRLSPLTESFTKAFASLDTKLSANLENLQARHQKLESEFIRLKAEGSKGVKQELEASLRKLEDELADAMESMSGSIVSRFTRQDEELKIQAQKFASFENDLQTLKNQQSKASQELTPKLEENSEAINELRTLLQTDVFNYFKKVNEERVQLHQKIDQLEGKVDQKMDGALLKMDAKMEAYLSITQKQIQEDKAQKERKKALKETIQQLTDLLND